MKWYRYLKAKFKSGKNLTDFSENFILASVKKLPKQKLDGTMANYIFAQDDSKIDYFIGKNLINSEDWDMIFEGCKLAIIECEDGKKQNTKTALSVELINQ